MNASLSLSEIACRRGGRLLFENFSLVLQAGDAAVVRGPNGVGKSSLLRLVAGLLEPASGAVARDGRLALADEKLALEKELSLEHALRFWAKIDCGSVSPALEAVGLGPLAEVPVRMLSTGQRKRAVLARTIASNADIWLLDEPANGLDSASLDGFGRAMAAHRANGGIILAASHQPLGLERAQDIALGSPS